MDLAVSRKALPAKVAQPRPVAALAVPVSGARRLAAASSAHAAVRRPLQESPRSAPGPSVPGVYVQGGGGEEDPELSAFRAHQQAAPRPSAAEEARTVLDQGRHGVLCTLSSSKDTPGFPASSVVEYACDGSGRPFFATSSLSPHTSDMLADGRVSLTVKSPSFQGMDCGRLTLQGVVGPVPEEERPRLREVFLKKYPSAFYVDFGDFQWFRMDQVVATRFNGGFGRANRLTVADYLAARPDPIYAFSAPVCGHMNADHQEDSKAMIRHFVGLTVDSVKMLDLDRLGINCSVTRKGQTFKLRLPFPSPAEDRKSIKEAIVDMTRKAKSAAAASARTPGGSE